MSVRINLTKKGKIGILAIVMLVLAGAGGYLLWRVNNPATISPDVSEATGGVGACCGPAGCVAGWKCDTSQSCSETKTVTCSYPTQVVSCGTYKGATGKPSSTCQYAGQSITCSYSIGGKCVKEDDPGGPTEGTCTNKCEWPQTLMSDKNCACELCQGISVNGCSGNPPASCPSLGSCPSGTVSCGDSTSHSSSVDCKKSTVTCTVYHKDCNNPSVIYRYCQTASSTNTCDSGAWVTKPTGTYAHCANIAYSANAIDSDGIDESSIAVKLNSTSRTTFAKSTSGTTTNISETLSSANNCLAAGSYTLNMSWKDKKGATSTNCALSTTFTVQAEQTNPNWSITKGVVEKCVDENTTNPTSQLTYTITVKNTGTAEGTITKIVDTLDTKVKSTEITNISKGGTYASGNITWTLSSTEKVFAINQEKVYTYVVTIPKTEFGEYKNVVTAYPSTGDNITANADIKADCTVAPQTGLFDTTLSKIVLGVALIMIGATFSHISTGFVNVYTWGKKLRTSIADMKEEQRKKNFEKKVVKR